MAKKSSGSSVRAMRAKKNAKIIPDHEIDFSDIPEMSDKQLKSMKRLGRPLLGSAARKLVAIRLDTLVLKGIKSKAKQEGKKYQSLINEILAKYVKKAAA